VSSDEDSTFHHSAKAVFGTTQWSVVALARDGMSPAAVAALETLCKSYWYPLYAYVRRKGLSSSDAQDLTQEFFYRLIDKKYLGSVDKKLGSFRSFLLASINHLLSNEWNKARALKRGGERQILSLEVEQAEGRFVQEAPVCDSPEKAFDRRWAMTFLERALVRLRQESVAAGKLSQFESLKPFLSNLAEDGDYAAVAEKLGMEPGGVAVAVHRLRVRYREFVRSDVAETVTSEEELNAEMKHLFASLI
jgi:RNA polymerase sigma-70 factor (ECF subfamily)